MTRKHVIAAIVLVGVVLAMDRAFLVDSSRAAPPGTAPPPRVPEPRLPHARSPSFPSTPSLPAATVAEPERVAEPVSDRAMGRHPEGAKAVLSLIGKRIGTPADKVAEIKDTIISSGICTAAECMKTKAALIAVVDRAGVKLESSTCYEVGCVVEVSGAIERGLIEAQRDGHIEWPVPAIFTKPIVDSNGSSSAVWVFFNPE